MCVVFRRLKKLPSLSDNIVGIASMIGLGLYVICMYICVYMYTCVCVRAYMRACVRACVCVCVCVRLVVITYQK